MRSRLFFITIIIALGAPLACAQTTTPQVHRLGEPAPVVLWNRTITVFRSYYEELNPAERAAKTADRLAALPEAATAWKIEAKETSRGQYSGVVITVNGQLALILLPGDVDTESGETMEVATERVTGNLRAAFEARAQQRQIPVLLRGIGLSVAATLLLLLALWLVIRARHVVLSRLDKTARARVSQLKLGGFDLHPLVHALNRSVTRLTSWAAAVMLIYVWLAFVLLRFPYSQPWGGGLDAFLINLFQKLGAGVLRSMPGMFTVIVIFLLTRIVTRLFTSIVGQVEKGDITVSWLHPDTARATRRLVVVMMWLFAITVAYPYIPGSATDVFKGLSVLVGLMISLGSAGLVNQVMSGLVVIYSRALKPGEYVRVGENFGVVTEVGMLSTKIITRKREEITIPNAVLVGTKTTNYSRHAADDRGTAVGTTVTIGYDAPWRQVHAMLLAAAERTAGVRQDPSPRVWQKALADFYVEYELVVNLEIPEDRVPVLSELHKNIQDAFNEFGVQIMSPHFVLQPNQPVVVPKTQWFSEPAVATKQNDGEQSPEAPSKE